MPVKIVWTPPLQFKISSWQYCRHNVCVCSNIDPRNLRAVPSER
jgi:hypothetical protein